jgi:lysophospholipase L1-like esterase
VIISLGTNDLKNVNTFDELQKIRQRVKADRVYWIMPPIKPAIQELVRRLAAEHGDVILPITQLSPDRVHPTPQGYRELAAKTKIKEQQ